MNYYLSRALFLVIILTVGFYVWQFYFQSEQISFKIPERKIHYYNDESKSLGDINIKIFYFIPNDRVKDISNWDFREVLSKNLEEIKLFHKLQFEGLSNLNYEIYPEPIIGLKETFFYDGLDTRFGNPHALETALEELKNKFSQDNSIFIIVYEGVGASGSEELAAGIMASGYFTKESQKDLASSILYHEFSHTLGLPDAYDHEKNIPSSNDIMGAGRNKSLKITYLSQDVKEKLGF